MLHREGEYPSLDQRVPDTDQKEIQAGPSRGVRRFMFYVVALIAVQTNQENVLDTSNLRLNMTSNGFQFIVDRVFVFPETSNTVVDHMFALIYFVHRTEGGSARTIIFQLSL